MSDVKISGLPASTTPLAGTEVLPIVQGGVTKQVSVDNLTAGKAVSASSATVTGNITFSGTGNRIVGDFSNATTANRVAFQTSTTNGNTNIAALPNGTSTTTSLTLYNSTDPDNSSRFRTTIQAASVAIASDLTGTGTYVPMTFFTGGSERLRITTTGVVGIGTSAPAGDFKFSVYGDDTYLPGINSVNSGSVIFSAYATSALCTVGARSNHALTLITNSAERIRITAGGEVLVAGNTDNGDYNLQCNGTGVWGAGAYVNGSDERIKENITPLDSGLDVVAKLNPVTYKYKESWSKDQSTQTGFIAQELLVALDGKSYVDGVVQQGGEYMSVAYQNIIPVLTKAIQELNAKIEAQAKEISALKTLS